MIIVIMAFFFVILKLCFVTGYQWDSNQTLNKILLHFIKTMTGMKDSVKIFDMSFISDIKYNFKKCKSFYKALHMFRNKKTVKKNEGIEKDF